MQCEVCRVTRVHLFAAYSLPNINLQHQYKHCSNCDRQVLRARAGRWRVLRKHSSSYFILIEVIRTSIPWNETASDAVSLQEQLGAMARKHLDGAVVAARA